MLTFYFSGADGVMREKETITSGMVGKQLKLEFSPEWDDLQKTVVFSAGDVTRDVLWQGNTVTIPHEVLAHPLHKLRVGVYGVSSDGTLVIPTIRALGPEIQPGADPSGDPSTNPNREIWSQLQVQLGDLSQLDTDAKENLVAAINELAANVDNNAVVVKDGATFVPNVSQEGVLSWSNDQDLANPASVCIMGPQGVQGTQGPVGPKGDKGEKGEKGDKGDPGADAVLTMFISPNGSDSNDGLTADTPKKTVKACVNAGANRISAKRGVYNEVVQLWNVGELEIFPTDNNLTYVVGVDREPIVFDTSDSVDVSSLIAYNSIKRVAYSNSANTQFNKVFTAKSQTPLYGGEYGSRYNATIWLLSEDEKTVCIKLKPVLTVAECEAEANTFSYVDGYIYINADMTSVAKVIVPTNWDCGIYINGANRFVLKEVEVRFAGSYNIDIRNCAYFDFYKCACKYTSYGSGFHPFNSNGVLTACYATKNYDGYGISGYGHTTYVDCISEFNFDDGMSHHNATTGTVIGGRYEGNGKGGITPAYGAKVNIYGGLYKDNGSFGIGYLYYSAEGAASGMVQGAVMVGNPVGLSVNANCDVTAMNCIYKDNTSDKDAKGNLTEYDANYVKSVNGVKPDENGNVKIEGIETGPSYTNVLPLAIRSDGTEYIGDNGEDGYRVGYRVSSSGVEKELETACCTGFIAVAPGDVIRIKNFTPETTGYGTIYFFTSVFSVGAGTLYTGTNSAANFILPDENGLLTFTVPDSGSVYFRLTAAIIDENTIITINEEI